MTTVSTRLAVAAALIAATLTAGCTVTTQSCHNGRCAVSLQGDGADTTLSLNGRVRVELRSVSGGRATVAVGGEPVTLGAGESAAAGGVRVRCTSVDGDEVKLLVTS